MFLINCVNARNLDIVSTKSSCIWFTRSILKLQLLEQEPELNEKTVVAVLTGGNVSPDELKNIV